MDERSDYGLPIIEYPMNNITSNIFEAPIYEIIEGVFYIVDSQGNRIAAVDMEMMESMEADDFYTGTDAPVEPLFITEQMVSEITDVGQPPLALDEFSPAISGWTASRDEMSVTLHFMDGSRLKLDTDTSRMFLLVVESGLNNFNRIRRIVNEMLTNRAMHATNGNIREKSEVVEIDVATKSCFSVATVDACNPFKGSVSRLGCRKGQFEEVFIRIAFRAALALLTMTTFLLACHSYMLTNSGMHAYNGNIDSSASELEQTLSEEVSQASGWDFWSTYEAEINTQVRRFDMNIQHQATDTSLITKSLQGGAMIRTAVMDDGALYNITMNTITEVQSAFEGTRRGAHTVKALRKLVETGGDINAPQHRVLKKHVDAAVKKAHLIESQSRGTTTFNFLLPRLIAIEGKMQVPTRLTMSKTLRKTVRTILRSMDLQQFIEVGTKSTAKWGRASRATYVMLRNVDFVPPRNVVVTESGLQLKNDNTGLVKGLGYIFGAVGSLVEGAVIVVDSILQLVGVTSPMVEVTPDIMFLTIAESMVQWIVDNNYVPDRHRMAVVIKAIDSGTEGFFTKVDKEGNVRFVFLLLGANFTPQLAAGEYNVNLHVLNKKRNQATTYPGLDTGLKHNPQQCWEDSPAFSEHEAPTKRAPTSKKSAKWRKIEEHARVLAEDDADTYPLSTIDDDTKVADKRCDSIFDEEYFDVDDDEEYDDCSEEVEAEREYEDTDEPVPLHGLSTFEEAVAELKSVDDTTTVQRTSDATVAKDNLKAFTGDDSWHAANWLKQGTVYYAPRDVAAEQWVTEFSEMFTGADTSQNNPTRPSFRNKAYMWATLQTLRGKLTSDPTRAYMTGLPWELLMVLWHSAAYAEGYEVQQTFDVPGLWANEAPSAGPLIVVKGTNQSLFRRLSIALCSYSTYMDVSFHADWGLNNALWLPIRESWIPTTGKFSNTWLASLTWLWGNTIPTRQVVVENTGRAAVFPNYMATHFAHSISWFEAPDDHITRRVVLLIVDATTAQVAQDILDWNYNDAGLADPGTSLTAFSIDERYNYLAAAHDAEAIIGAMSSAISPAIRTIMDKFLAHTAVRHRLPNITMTNTAYGTWDYPVQSMDELWFGSPAEVKLDAARVALATRGLLGNYLTPTLYADWNSAEDGDADIYGIDIFYPKIDLQFSVLWVLSWYKGVGDPPPRMIRDVANPSLITRKHVSERLFDNVMKVQKFGCTNLLNPPRLASTTIDDGIVSTHAMRVFSTWNDAWSCQCSRYFNIEEVVGMAFNDNFAWTCWCGLGRKLSGVLIANRNMPNFAPAAGAVTYILSERDSWNGAALLHYKPQRLICYQSYSHSGIFSSKLFCIWTMLPTMHASAISHAVLAPAGILALPLRNYYNAALSPAMAQAFGYAVALTGVTNEYFSCDAELEVPSFLLGGNRLVGSFDAEW